MIQINQLNLRLEQDEEELVRKSSKILGISRDRIFDFTIVKKSIDARKKPNIYLSYVVRFSVKEEKSLLKKCHDKRVQYVEENKYCFPKHGDCEMPSRPVVIGMGPAGLFCAYFLAKHGYKPIVLERGLDVDSRKRDVESFWEGEKLKCSSNVQFGEGGAGTFSDGKLNTLVKDKDGRNREVLKTFVEFGAPENILYDGKPHIGTDILIDIVKNMREKIKELGGEVKFESRITSLIMDDGRLTGLVINEKERIDTNIAVLAIGHSARDTFYTLFEQGVPMEPKSFAVGFRVQHPQEMIDLAQYGRNNSDVLSPASYKVVAQTSSGRSVYSFCMCPGGYVVNASSEEERLAVNGMSYSDRAGRNANSAIIVSVTPLDYDAEGPLAGVEFQRKLEHRAWCAGHGNIPCEYYGDFKSDVLGQTRNSYDCMVEPAFKGKFTFADLTNILPTELNSAFVEGMETFGSTIRGFNREDAILAGVESRTSSPVRILRDDSLQSEVRGLYPCGEGAGYAGGITSAAMDGIRIAERIAMQYKPLDV